MFVQEVRHAADRAREGGPHLFRLASLFSVDLTGVETQCRSTLSEEHRYPHLQYGTRKPYPTKGIQTQSTPILDPFVIHEALLSLPSAYGDQVKPHCHQLDFNPILI